MTVRSISNAMEILRYLAVSDRPQGVNGIARAMSLAPSSVFNILKTLTQETLVRFDPASRRYTIDPDARQLFRPKQDLSLWFDKLRRQLGQLARAHLVSCGLWELSGRRVILREVFDSPDPTRVHLALGQRLPSHIGAIGRCVAAHEGLSRDQIATVVAEVRWQSPPSADAFWQDLQHVLARGWAIDHSNYIRGLTTLAAPIRDAGGRVLFCLTGTGFGGQHDGDRLETIGERLAQIAAAARDERARLLAH